MIKCGHCNPEFQIVSWFECDCICHKTLKELSKKEFPVACLHDSCPICNGAGIRKDNGGLCVHALSCPCPKCSFTC